MYAKKQEAYKKGSNALIKYVKYNNFKLSKYRKKKNPASIEEGF